MKKFLKALAVFACAIALVAGSVAATLAYLTATTDPIVNTFTVGKVSIALTETSSDAYLVGGKYKLIPGHKYVKDPAISVDDESEACWLFVKVENGIADIEAAGETTIASQLAANGWALVDGETNVYGRSTTSAAGAKVNVFESFTIDGTTKDFSSYVSANITITAYAVQAEGFANANLAWAASGFATPVEPPVEP